MMSITAIPVFIFIRYEVKISSLPDTPDPYLTQQETSSYF